MQLFRVLAEQLYHCLMVLVRLADLDQWCPSQLLVFVSLWRPPIFVFLLAKGGNVAFSSQYRLLFEHASLEVQEGGMKQPADRQASCTVDPLQTQAYDKHAVRTMPRLLRVINLHYNHIPPLTQIKESIAVYVVE